jgi:hypothetical protein
MDNFVLRMNRAPTVMVGARSLMNWSEMDGSRFDSQDELETVYQIPARIGIDPRQIKLHHALVPERGRPVDRSAPHDEQFREAGHAVVVLDGGLDEVVWPPRPQLPTGFDRNGVQRTLGPSELVHVQHGTCVQLNERVQLRVVGLRCHDWSAVVKLFCEHE